MAQAIQLKTSTDERGSLTVCQDDLPFEIKRFFIIHDVNAPRGQHRQRETVQALIATAGRVRVTCEVAGRSEEFILDHPGQCLVVPPEDFRTMFFEAGASLLVLSSHKYDPSDTIWER